MKKLSTKLICLLASVSLFLILSPAPVPAETPLDKVIEGAKKEGAITMISPTGFTAKSFKRVRDEIRKKFGVDLEFKFEAGWFPKDFAKALTEHKSGITPTFDLFITSSTYIVRGIEDGVLEKVDWESLILPGTPLELIFGRPPQHASLHGYGIIANTGYQGGVLYNPTKIPADKLPQTLMDLADPQWKGVVGVNRGTSVWLNQCWVLGKERVFESLRAIIKNGGIVGGSKDNMTRLLMDEVVMAYMNGSFLPRIKEKGAPVEWQTLDAPIVVPFGFAIRKGTPHLNAAKLVATYLTSPDGYRLMREEAQMGNIYYPDNFIHDMYVRDKKRGLNMFMKEASDMLDWVVTEEAKSWEKEIKTILRGG